MDRLTSVLGSINAKRKRVARFNFYRCHLAYFVAVIPVCSIVLYGSNTGPIGEAGGYGMRYIDELFLATSAMTTTGLNTVNLDSATGYQQSVLFVLMLLGDLSTASISVVLVRRWIFRRQLPREEKQSATLRTVVQNIDEERALRKRRPTRQLRHRHVHCTTDETRQELSDSSSSTRTSLSHKHLSHQHRLGGIPLPWQTSLWKSVTSRPSQWLHLSDLTPGHHDYLSFEPHLDRRGRFRKLSRSEYEELGGVEYRALSLVSLILPTYTAFWLLITLIILAPYASDNRPVADVLTSQPGQLRPDWWGVFMALRTRKEGRTPNVIPECDNATEFCAKGRDDIIYLRRTAKL